MALRRSAGAVSAAAWTAAPRGLAAAGDLQPGGACASRALRGVAAPATGGEIYASSRANKTGLSWELDGVMRSGAHDLRGVFGPGTLRGFATRGALCGFLRAHLFVYDALEDALDGARGPTADAWQPLAPLLKRTQALRADVELLGGDVGVPSPATAAYVDAVRRAAEVEAEPGAPPLLLGHLYTRFLADLFGGSLLGWPTKLALGLDAVPAYYVHSPEVANDLSGTIERFYELLNDAGEGLSEEGTRRVVEEARTAFQLNAGVYLEGPGGPGAGMFALAALGALRVAAGHARHRILSAEPARDVFGRLVTPAPAA